MDDDIVEIFGFVMLCFVCVDYCVLFEGGECIGESVVEMCVVLVFFDWF